MKTRTSTSCACCAPLTLQTSSLDRRHFLGGLAAFAASAVPLAGDRAFAQAGAPRRIDVHHHLVPQKYMEMVAGTRIGAQPRPWSPEVSLADMDKNGIETAIVSIVQPGVWFRGEVQKSRDIAREVNEIGARMMQDHPGRFGLWAALSLPDTEGSLKEIQYAMDVLKADGIGLMTSYGDKYLGHDSFAPIYEELNRRKAVVYIHPQTPDCCRNIASDMPASSIEYATDTTRSIGSLIFSGTAARYPDIKWIWSHSGGTMPFLLSRFEVVDKETRDRTKIPNGAVFEIRKFFYDTAQGNHKGALQALTALVPNSQILFGTDFPLRPGSDEVQGIGSFGFTPADLKSIDRDNALKLIPRLKA